MGVTLLVMSAFVLQACATAPTREASDNCAPNRAPLERVLDGYNQRMAENVVAGALAGAVLGGLTAAATGNNVGAGMLIGGGLGAVGGAVKGYLEKKQKQGANNDQLLAAAVSKDIRASTADIGSLQSATRRLNECRLGQINDLKAKIAAGQPREVSMARLTDIRRFISQDAQLIEDVTGEVSTANLTMADAYGVTSKVNVDRTKAKVSDYQPIAPFVAAGRPSSYAYATAGVNVRAGRGGSAPKIGGLAAGQRVGVVNGNPGSGWVEIAYGGRQAYVAGQYLSASPAGGASASAPKQTPVSAMPTVDTRMRGANDEVAVLLVSEKNYAAESQAQAAFLNEELDSIDSLLR